MSIYPIMEASHIIVCLPIQHWRPGFNMYYIKGGLRDPFISSRVGLLVQRGPLSLCCLNGGPNIFKGGPVKPWPRPKIYIMYIYNPGGQAFTCFCQRGGWWPLYFIKDGPSGSKGAHSLCSLNEGPKICWYNLEARLLHVYLSKGAEGPLHFYQGWVLWFKGAHSFCCLKEGPKICWYNLEPRLLLVFFFVKGGWGPPSFHQGWALWFKGGPLPLLFKWRA